MNFKIDVRPGGQEFMVEPGQTVLDGALAAGVILPYSCRNGTCSTCSGRVVSGAFDAGKAPERILERADLGRGMTLLCQARPLSDLVIEAEEVHLASDILVRKMPVRVLALKPLAPDVVQVTLQLPSNQPFRFQPGQYLDFLLRDGRRRSYSIACPRTEDHQIVLHVRHQRGGALTDRLFDAGEEPPIRVRDILRIEGPLGSFFVRDGASPLIFLASGTGFAPIRAMLEDLIAGGDTRSMTLYWGGRRPDDLYQQDLARQWQNLHGNFRFIPVVSEPLEADGWTGRTGWVHQAVMMDFPDLSAHEVYACGAPVMVDAARRDFVRCCGLNPAAFHADAFTTAADRAAVLLA